MKHKMGSTQTYEMHFNEFESGLAMAEVLLCNTTNNGPALSSALAKPSDFHKGITNAHTCEVDVA